MRLNVYDTFVSLICLMDARSLLIIQALLLLGYGRNGYSPEYDEDTFYDKEYRGVRHNKC